MRKMRRMRMRGSGDLLNFFGSKEENRTRLDMKS